MGQAPILGHGFDTLRYLTSDARIVLSKAAAGLDSSILFIGATMGLVGLLTYGYLIVRMIKLGRFALRHANVSTLGVVYLVSLLALGVHSLFVNSAFYPWVLIWFWIMTGVLERSLGSKARSG